MQFELYEKTSGNDEPSKVIALTEHQAQAILHKWKSAPNADLIDAGGRLIEVVNRNEWRIRSKNQVKLEDMSGRGWVCGYGTHHKMSDGGYADQATGKREWSATKCGCDKKFGVADFVVRDWCFRIYGVKYEADIQPIMQNEFLRTQSLVLQ